MKFLFKSNLSNRITFTLMAVIMAILVMLNILPYNSTKNLLDLRKEDKVLSDLKNYVDLYNDLSGSIKPDGAHADPGEFYSRLNTVSGLYAFGDNRMLIIGPDRIVVYDSDRKKPQTGSVFMLMVPAVLHDDIPVYRSRLDGPVLRSYAVSRISRSGEPQNGARGYMICVINNDYEYLFSLSNTRYFWFFVSFVVLLVSAVAAFFMARYIRRRVSALKNGIVKIREGNYNHQIALRGKDEFSDIADEFNGLSGRLKQTENLRRQFISDAAHEFRTPLAAITLLADSILSAKDISADEITDFITDIKSESEHLTRISEKLLLLSRLESEYDAGEGSADAVRVINRAVKLLSPKFRQNDSTIRLILDDNLYIAGDEDIVFQIICNLIENAVKYNRQGGTTTVFLYEKGDRIIFTVDDEGNGISDDDALHIFDRFYRIDKSRTRDSGGTGLGLAIVRKSVELLGGTISFENRQGGGSRFTVNFRLYRN